MPRASKVVCGGGDCARCGLNSSSFDPLPSCPDDIVSLLIVEDGGHGLYEAEEGR